MTSCAFEYNILEYQEEILDVGEQYASFLTSCEIAHLGGFYLLECLGHVGIERREESRTELRTFLL